MKNKIAVLFCLVPFIVQAQTWSLKVGNPSADYMAASDANGFAWFWANANGQFRYGGETLGYSSFSDWTVPATDDNGAPWVPGGEILYPDNNGNPLASFSIQLQTQPAGGQFLVDSVSGALSVVPEPSTNGFFFAHINNWPDATAPLPVTVTDTNSANVWPAFAAGLSFGFVVCGFGWILRLTKRIGSHHD